MRTDLPSADSDVSHPLELFFEIQLLSNNRVAVKTWKGTDPRGRQQVLRYLVNNLLQPCAVSFTLYTKM